MLDFLRKQMKWVMAIIVVAFLLSTFFMYEGRSSRRSPSVNSDGTMNDYEVAQINGRSLMRSELENRTRNYLSTLNSRNAASLDMGAIYQTVLNQAVLESQLVKEIDEQGIRVSDSDAEQAMKAYADTYYPTRETFYQALENSGIKVEDYKRNLARQLAVDQLMSNAIGEIEISEDKALEFYDSMKTLFYTQPEGFMVHMADFNNSKDAEAFRAKLTAGESWDVIASEDKPESGEIVNITKTPVFLPASALRMGTLSNMASLDIAEPSEVFAVSSTDFAVGMKASHVDQTTRPYAEVSADIRTLLTQEEQRKRLADYEQTLMTKAQLVINDADLFKTIRNEELGVRNEKTEEPVETPAPEVKEEVKSEEPAAPVEEVKEEEKTEKTETAPAETVSGEELEVRGEKTEEPAEAPKEETKPEEKSAEPELKEEVKSKDTPAPVEEVKEEEKTEETPAPAPEVKEEVKAESAEKAADEVKEVKEEVEKTVETMTESLDSNKLEIPTETK